MIFDLHNDYPTVLPRTSRYKYAVRMAERGATATAAIFTTELGVENACRTIDEVTTELLQTEVRIPIAVEDMGFLSETELGTFDFSRFFYCSLTWNYNNAYAGGAMDDGRLTNSGRRLISTMNGKCAVDLAHLNRASFFDVLDLAEKPICSHTGFTDHPRCLNEAQIRALIERHVPIGLSAVTKFSGAETAVGFAAAIDKFVQRYGCDCLCIGTDFYGSTDFPTDLSDYSAFGSVIEQLEKFGYSDDDCDKILYNNAKRFYKEIVSERRL